MRFAFLFFFPLVFFSFCKQSTPICDTQELPQKLSGITTKIILANLLPT
jgi:hypothetical protein